MKKEHLFLLAFTFLFTSAIWCGEYEFEKITTNDGLSRDNVFWITQDKNGLMWFATDFGINSYDGYTVRSFTAKGENELLTKKIKQICADHEGNIWICSQVGLVIFNTKTEEFRNFYTFHGNDSIKVTNVRALHCDSSGTMWFSQHQKPHLLTYSNGVLNISAFNEKNKQSIAKIKSDNHGKIWVKSNVSLMRLNEQHKADLIIKSSKEHGLTKMMDFTFDKNNNVWIGGFPSLIKVEILKSVTGKDSLKIHSKQNTFSFFPERNFVSSLAYDKNTNTIWQGTAVDGLREIRAVNEAKNQYTQILHEAELGNPKALNVNSIEHVFVDNSGIIWLGTEGGGANKLDFNKSKFHLVDASKFNNIRSQFIKGIYQYDSTNYLVGISADGYAVYNASKDQVFNKGKFLQILEAGQQVNQFNVIEEFNINGTKTVWIGDRLKPLRIAIFNEKNEVIKTIEPFKYKVSSSRGINVICRYSENSFLLGSNSDVVLITLKDGNLLKKSPFTLKPIKLQGRTIKSVNHILVDTKGSIWISTQREGLIRIDSTSNLLSENISFHAYLKTTNEESPVKAKEINTVFEGKDGNIWIGTNGNGLYNYSYDNNSFKYFNIQDGWIASSVFSILQANNEDIWFATDEGLTVFQTNEKQGVQFIHYNQNDGLQGKVFNLNSCYKNNKGQLFFGGVNGFNVVTPEAIKGNTFVPQTHITNIQIQDRDLTIKPRKVIYEALQKVDSVPRIDLYHNDNAIQISFSALSYSNPDKNLYAFQLEGADNEWRYVTSAERKAYYSALPVGDYVFKIKSSNSDGIWNEKPIVLSIAVHPPWWETILFIISVIIIVFGLSYSFYRYRISQLKKQKQVLEHKVEERTKDLKQANINLQERQEEIMTQSEEIQQQNEEILVINKKLEEQKAEISKAHRNTQKLGEVGKQMTATFDIISIFDMIYDYVISIVEVASFRLGFYDEKHNLIYYPAFVTDGKRAEEFTRSLEQKNSFSVWAFKNQKSVFINDMDTEYFDYLPEKPIFAGRAQINSCLILPLTMGENKIGVMVMDSYFKNAFSESDFNNLQTLGSYMSVALANANSYKLIRENQKHAMKSINAAKNIQFAFLPRAEFIQSYVDSFVLFNPKDIVSGDFYWFYPIEEDNTKPCDFFIAAVDCTGHGVPGALMSILGNNLLRDIIINRTIYNPSQILEEMNLEVQKALKQNETKNNDGMDMAIIRVKETTKGFRIDYGGAKNPLCVHKQNDNSFEIIKASRHSIGGLSRRNKKEFQSVELELGKGDSLYLFSDGYADQNSLEREKFGRDNLFKLLCDIANYPTEKQLDILQTRLEEHMQNENQRDDITVVGLKL